MKIDCAAAINASCGTTALCVVPLPERTRAAEHLFPFAQAMKEAITSSVLGRIVKTVPAPQPRDIEGTTARHSLRRGRI